MGELVIEHGTNKQRLMNEVLKRLKSVCGRVKLWPRGSKRGSSADATLYLIAIRYEKIRIHSKHAFRDEV